jgi:hypothetical protein
VIGIRKDDQLGVGQALLQDVGIVGRDDDVVTTLHDQSGLTDVLQVVEHAFALGDVLADGLALVGDPLGAHLRIAVLALPFALEEGEARLAAGGRRGEVHGEPQVLGRIVGSRKDRMRLASRHVGAARAGAHQDQPTHQLAALQGDFLGDHAADGKAQHVDLGEPQALDESDGIGAHFGEAGGNGAGA